MNNNRTHLIGVLLVLLGAASYGSLTPAVKLAVWDGWEANSLSFWQSMAGTALLLLIWLAASRFRPSLRLPVKVWIWLAVIGICGLSLTTVFYNQTLARLDASLSIVLLFQYTWITIFLESIRARRWPSRSKWLAVGLIFAGTILAAGLLEREIGGLDPAGLAYGLLSAMSYSLFFFLSGFLPSSLEPLAKSAVMAVAALAFLGALQGAGWSASAGSGDVPLAVWGLLLGLLGTALPTVCFNAGIPKIGPGLAALLGSMEIPAAMLFSYALLGESLSWQQGLGVAVILAGILAAQSRQEASAGLRPGSEE